MKRLALALSLIVAFVTCESGGGVTGPGGRDGRPQFDDPKRQAACNEAVARMTNPAEFDPVVPSEAHRIGLDMWNEWKCAEGGRIDS